jgi:hypothetical protein
MPFRFKNAYYPGPGSVPCDGGIAELGSSKELWIQRRLEK